MKVIAIDHGLDLAQNFGSVRSPGVHMSDLYGSYYAKLDPKRYGAKPGESKPLELFEAGMVWEEALEDKLKERLALAMGSGRPGEFVTEEGIIYSPDLLIFNHVTRNGEIKLTFMSPKGFIWKPGQKGAIPEKANKYLTQIKCYCKHIPTRYARLYVFFVTEAAPWKKPGQALRAWDIEFTQHEIDEEWDLIWRHAKKEGLLKGLKKP